MEFGAKAVYLGQLLYPLTTHYHCDSVREAEVRQLGLEESSVKKAFSLWCFLHILMSYTYSCPTHDKHVVNIKIRVSFLRFLFSTVSKTLILRIHTAGGGCTCFLIIPFNSVVLQWGRKASFSCYMDRQV